MKKLLCLIQALILCVLLVTPAFAEESIFVPSISYKDGIEIVLAEMNSEDMMGCIIVTSVSGAKNTLTDITNEERALLLDVYERLENESLKLPINSEYVIRDLVSIDFKNAGCVEAGHGHKEWLEKDNTFIKITFKNKKVEEGKQLKVYTYHEGKWILNETVFNEDGTITVTFEDIGPVAFCIVDPSSAGQGGGCSCKVNWLWILILLLILATATLMVEIYRRFDRDGKGDEEDGDESKKEPGEESNQN